MTPWKKWLGLIGWILVCLAVGFLSAQFSPDIWYQSVQKPIWMPADWIFAPVWTVLYLIMGVAAWLVWKDRGFSGAATALGVFAGQFLFNAAWSVLFFGLHRPDLALIDIGLLWVAIVITIFFFHNKSPAAAFLLLPYIAWVSFAMILNFEIWRLN